MEDWRLSEYYQIEGKMTFMGQRHEQPQPQHSDDFEVLLEGIIETLQTSQTIHSHTVLDMLSQVLNLHRTQIQIERLRNAEKLEVLHEQMESMAEEFTRERMRLEIDLEDFKRQSHEEMGRVVAEQMMQSEEELTRLAKQKRKQEEEFNLLLLKTEDEYHKKERDMESKMEQSVNEAKIELPETWFPFPQEDYKENHGMQLVTLQKQSREYKQVVTEFRRTNQGSFTIVNIERIQNPFLYRAYQFHKAEVEDKLSRMGFRDQVEMMLFHGTRHNLKEVLAAQSFDWRLNGKNGTAYGKGNYFALNASYASGNTYSVPSRSGEKVVFYARVLVGRYGQGSSNIPRPPTDHNGVMYDSVVNSTSSPSIFVVFDNWHAYPEYAITFRC